jgi:hypothetical protein
LPGIELNRPLRLLLHNRWPSRNSLATAEVTHSWLDEIARSQLAFVLRHTHRTCNGSSLPRQPPFDRRVCQPVLITARR